MQACSRPCKQGKARAANWSHCSVGSCERSVHRPDLGQGMRTRESGLMCAHHFKSFPTNPTRCGSVQIPNNSRPTSTVSVSSHYTFAPPLVTMIWKRLGVSQTSARAQATQPTVGCQARATLVLFTVASGSLLCGHPTISWEVQALMHA